MFAFVGAHLGRQFEFVQSEWINSGAFFGAGDERDPLVGSNDGGRQPDYPASSGPEASSRSAAIRRHAGRRVRAVEIVQVVAIAIAAGMRVKDLAQVPLSFPTYAGIIGRVAYRAAGQLSRELGWRGHQVEP